MSLSQLHSSTGLLSGRGVWAVFLHPMIMRWTYLVQWYLPNVTLDKGLLLICPFNQVRFKMAFCYCKLITTNKKFHLFTSSHALMFVSVCTTADECRHPRPLICSVLNRRTFWQWWWQCIACVMLTDDCWTCMKITELTNIFITNIFLKFD